MKEFLWIPGEGYDDLALKRIQNHFKRPLEPMGEAWFMGEERKMFNSLFGDLEKLPINELMDAFEEISSGTSCFGHLDEWDQWYHYLLGQLVPKNHEDYGDYLLEYLLTGFFTQYPQGVKEEPYSGFLDDAINTLGKCIMDKECWDRENIVIGKLLWPSINQNKTWCWWDASGDLSSSLFFCIKYLPSELIPNWINSVFNIKSPHWRAQIIVWFVGAYKILNNLIEQPEDFDFNDRPYIGWAWSYCIKKELVQECFLPHWNRIRVLQAIQNYFDEKIFKEWLGSISEYDYLKRELAEIPNTFHKLYVLPNSELKARLNRIN